MTALDSLLTQVRACTLCAEYLPRGPRPVLQLHPAARILIVGQAPGRKVHETGIPFNDASGDRLRTWLGIGRDVFYDPRQIAILPIGFCYPGTGQTGDLPPRSECAATWRAPLMAHMANIKLTLVLGQYALAYHLPNQSKKVTEVVKAWQQYWPDTLPLPHPSPRNNRWLKQNSWFEQDLLPVLQRQVALVLQG